MTISGTQASTALPTTTAARAAAMPASGDHGMAQLVGVNDHLKTTGGGNSAAAAGAAMIAMPLSPFDRIQMLLQDLMIAIQQLNQPIKQYPPSPPFDPPFDPYGPYGPYPPIEPPHPGCPHMDMPPIGPIDPLPPIPSVTKKAPEVGDVIGATAPTTGAPSAEITVKSVHGTYKSRDKAVAAAKHLAGIFDNKPFGVAVSGLPGQERYTVVGLSSSAPLTAAKADTISGVVTDGWGLDTIAFSATTAKRVQLGAPIGPVYKDGDTPPAPPAPPAPVPAPAPAPHTH